MKRQVLDGADMFLLGRAVGVEELKRDGEERKNERTNRVGASTRALLFQQLSSSQVRKEWRTKG